MWTPPPHCLRLSLVLASVLCLPGAGLCQQGGNTAKTLRKKLAAFATTLEAIALTKKQINALESESYAERRAAMASLVGATGLHDVLTNSEARLTKEGRTALKVISEAQAETGAEEKLRFLMRQVQTEKVAGLADVVLGAWEGREATSSESSRLSREALKATVEAKDLPNLKEALTSSTPFVRELGLIGIQKLQAPQADVAALIEPLLKDPQETVRLEAAVVAASHQNRASLTTLAGLLKSEVFHLRNQSHEILASITEQDFGYYSDGNLKDRQTASNLWIRWVAKFGGKAPMKFEEIQHWLQDGDDLFE